MSAVETAKKTKEYPDGKNDILRILQNQLRLQGSFERSATGSPNAATIAVRRGLIEILDGTVKEIVEKYSKLGYDKAIQDGLTIIRAKLDEQVASNAKRQHAKRAQRPKAKDAPKKAVGKSKAAQTI